MEGKDFSQHIGQKEYDESGKMISLMLRTCRHIFGLWKTVVWGNQLCVTKDIPKIKSKGVYVGYLIKNWRYWTK